MPAPLHAITQNGFDAGHAHDILRALMDDGAAIVRTLVKQAEAEPVPHPFWGDKAPVEHPTEHIARCYDRIARSIRRTIALAKHLDDPVRLRPTHPPVEPKAPKPTPSPANDARPERPEAADRPDEPDWNEHLSQDLDRPLAEVVDEIAADLDTVASHAADISTPDHGPAPGPANRPQASPIAKLTRLRPTTHRLPARKPGG